VKLHLSLATRDLRKSVAFYETLLGAPPAKQLPDYALFITADPGLELALDLNPKAKAPRRQHFGLAVESVAEVDAQIARLQRAGYDVDVERAETCCYANQTKVWARDPDGRRWETYVVHAEVDA
jgi:catechol 2,3-dioxygenase-like lactoylglutathione lyase family enzyme